MRSYLYSKSYSCSYFQSYFIASFCLIPGSCSIAARHSTGRCGIATRHSSQAAVLPSLFSNFLRISTQVGPIGDQHIISSSPKCVNITPGLTGDATLGRICSSSALFPNFSVHLLHSHGGGTPRARRLSPGCSGAPSDRRAGNVGCGERARSRATGAQPDSSSRTWLGPADAWPLGHFVGSMVPPRS